MRLLAAVRLSNDTDETTSPERQRAATAAYAAAGGHTIVAVAEDRDVSGAVAPADRPALGPWLARTADWDGLIVSKLDRLSRSLIDFADLIRWMQDNHKTLICLDPQIDLSTATGRLMAQIVMSFAEYEREQIRSRVKDAYDHIRAQGGYAGGAVPFGFTAVRSDGRGWEYRQHAVYAPVVREMADRALAGMPWRQIAIWLNSEGIPTSRNVLRREKGQPDTGNGWSVQAVKNVLTSPAIAGMHTADGKPLRGDDGLAVQRCEGIVTRQEWDKLRAVRGPERKANRVDGHPLLGVAYCMKCEAPMYSMSATVKGKSYRYYRCAKRSEANACPTLNIRADDLETVAWLAFSSAGNGKHVTRRHVIAAEDHSAEIAEVSEGIEQLDSEYKAGRLHARSYSRMITALEETLDTLGDLPSVPERIDYEETGEPFEDLWERSDDMQRRAMMRDTEFRIYAAKDASGLSVAVPVREFDQIIVS